MKTPLLSSRTRSRGFTLVEVLVSITVLGLMMVGVAQMLNSAINATLGGYKHMDADTQARMVLDRIAFDISKITLRADVDYSSLKIAQDGSNINDQMAFFSESGGYYPSDLTGVSQKSDVALVGYQINSGNQLVRLSKGLAWNGVNSTDTAMCFLPKTIASTWPLVPTGTDPNYQVIGDQVFRMNYCYLVQNRYSTRTTAAMNTTATTLSDVPWVTPDTTANGLQDVQAVIVSIAVLDAQSRSAVSAATLTTAAGKLQTDQITSNSGSAAYLPLTLWKKNLQTNSLGLPKAVASQVRFYQRYCYINHVQ